MVSAFANLVAAFNSDVTRFLIDKARASMGGGATRDQSATQAASNQPAVRQLPLKDPARVSDQVTLASVNASAPRLGTPSREAIVTAYHAALQSQTPAARTGNEAAAPSKTLDTQSVTPDPVMARDWHHNAPRFGSADAQQRLTHFRTNLYTLGGCHASVP
jgi:hypothetical protein